MKNVLVAFVLMAAVLSGCGVADTPDAKTADHPTATTKTPAATPDVLETTAKIPAATADVPEPARASAPDVPVAVGCPSARRPLPV